MKTIKCTHIDTASHGYVSVAKEDIRLLGIQDKISHYSGHSFSRVYLEEDCDATIFMERAKELGVNVAVGSSYNEHFSISHNYSAELFDFKPRVGVKYIGNDERKYEIFAIENTKIISMGTDGKLYSLPTSNPFRYIQGMAV